MNTNRLQISACKIGRFSIPTVINPEFHHRLTVMSKKRTTILCAALVVLVATGILIGQMMTVTSSNADLKLSFVRYTNDSAGASVAVLELHNTGSADVLPRWGVADL